MDRDWYYQVWMHCNYDKVVNVIKTYKDEWMARNDANIRNAAERHDTVGDLPPSVFYYVRPVTEDQLNEGLRERFYRHRKRVKEYFLSHYKGAFRPYAAILAKSMKHSIETCEYGTSIRLNDKGGKLAGCRLDYDQVTAMTCSAVYSGISRVCLEVAFDRMGNIDSAFVKEFKDEDQLLDWLGSTDAATEAIEDKLLEIYCDRYRLLGAFQDND